MVLGNGGLTLGAAGTPVTFASWNVRGLGKPTKINRVLSHLDTLGVKVAFIQETHLTLSGHKKVNRGWVSQSFHSLFNSKARGVAILIHRSIPFISSNIIADRNGRYVIVTGSLFNTPLVLANIYAPNINDPQFFVNFFSTLPSVNSHHLVIGGDLNCCLHNLDTTSNRTSANYKVAEVINTFLRDYGISDIWRTLNPNARGYSFFSPVHYTFSRIDYFLVDSKLLPTIQSCTYHARVISDHSPLLLTIMFENSFSRSPWRMNTRLLSDVNHTDFISNQIDFFIETNATSNISYSVLWETFKAYMRGQLISRVSFEKRQRNSKLTDLSNRILQMEHEYACSQSPSLYKEMLLLKSDFDSLSISDAEEMLIRSRHTFYEYGEKPTRLLAHQLRQMSASQLISEINTSSGLSREPSEINNAFRNFYSSLYTSEQNPTLEELDQFFDSFPIPTVDHSTAKALESPITEKEVNDAITAMQSGKSPGPDGFPVEFFKRFSVKLLPLLLKMYNESLHSSLLPCTLRQAQISLLLKKNKDPRCCSSYRPISLLNVDVKILAKILARRLEKVLPKIVSADQTGFIKNRFSFFNMRRLFNIIYNVPDLDTPELLVSLDAEKAFDRVEWKFLFYTLERFGFGKTFISWIRLLYTSPSASIRTNNNFSKYFNIGRGTRQGCPLSPLLFALAIEPLSLALRHNTQIAGIIRDGQEQKVSLYADDLLLYISDPDNSLPHVFRILDQFHDLSGYKLNLEKSELFPINKSARQLPFASLPFKVTNTFVYLGICVTDKFSKLFSNNFLPLISQTELNLKRWTSLPLSVAGRINSVQMNILPKFTYLFQNIPVFIPKSFFHRLDGMISSFIWGGKPPRIPKNILQRPKCLGGLAAPNFLAYYWASNIRIVVHWLYEDPGADAPSWYILESLSCQPSSLPVLVYSSISASLTEFTKNKVVKSTLRIWAQIRRHFGWLSFSLNSPIIFNPAFKPSLLDKTFAHWHNLGIKSFFHLFSDNILCSFEQLCLKFNLPKSHWFRYLQVRDFLCKILPQFPSLPPANSCDALLKRPLSFKGMISALYKEILHMQRSSSLSVKRDWELDLGETIPDDLWQSILKRAHTSSICARHSFMQCKIIHRTHWTKVKISKFFPDVSPSCNRCKMIPATHAHMFWTCAALEEFWSLIFKTISDCLNKKVAPCPFIALFGTSRVTLTLSKSEADCIAFVTLLARRLILLRWKGASPPTFTHWISDVLYFLKLEKLKHSLRGSSKNFYKIWSPFLNYIKEKVQLPAVP